MILAMAQLEFLETISPIVWLVEVYTFLSDIQIGNKKTC